MGKNRTQKIGKLTNYGVVAGRIEPVKNADYSDVIMGVSGVFNLRTQLNDALIDSYPDLQFGQFSLAPEPLWAWGCLV